MVRPAGPGVFSATYSNVPVYEYQFGEGLKEHVMRRRGDDWINATHILKAAGFDKPARTRILEREVQKEMHEKVQGGYGKYQGTWVPLEQGQALAQRNNIYDKLRVIFEYIPGNDSPPPAPKHTTNKPKIPKKPPPVPKWSNSLSMVAPRVQNDYDNLSSQMNDDESMADDITVASASYLGDEDRYESRQSTGHRKRRREEDAKNALEQAHVVYSDELLDYFMLQAEAAAMTAKPEPPPNYQPDWIIDEDAHTALHWASAMGDIEIMKQLKRFGATLDIPNVRGETPLMRTVLFTNCLDKQSMPAVLKELISTVPCQDYCGSNVLHHTAAVTKVRHKHHCARYYLDVILNKMQEGLEPDHVRRIIDAQDQNGDTAVHIAARNGARKCVRALMGRGASTDIPNNDGITAAVEIQELNNSRRMERDRYAAASSSPFAPDSNHRASFMDAIGDDPAHQDISHVSEAAMSIQAKVTPLVMDKFQELAKSFDEELKEKEESEKEARRILNSTQDELITTRNQILELSYDNDQPEAHEQKVQHLRHLENTVIGLIEQQQQIQLLARTQHEESKQNGHLGQEDDGVAERLMLARQLIEQQEKRKQLVVQYRDALAVAGAGQNGEKYCRLISKCVGQDVETMDDNLDSLIEQLKQQETDRNLETIDS
ncbi:Cell division cycle-related res1 sct1 [Hyphodiscus hymeniophilus]|uniref:Cell division cycle-related res1 sct1 n=1 Tax=Hyphodiscus hymeniophilus TaxID=353542 RepID=A0A9P7B0C1_9HELO|nr:Cell division cycle-related res1 sct1 [Hyphodiscus hymeniophilus]